MFQAHVWLALVARAWHYLWLYSVSHAPNENPTSGLFVRVVQIARPSGIIRSPIAKQPLEVMGKGVEQFDHRLVVIAARRGEQEAQDEAAETDHTVQFAAKVLQGLAATDSIISGADKITGLF